MNLFFRTVSCSITRNLPLENTIYIRRTTMLTTPSLFLERALAFAEQSNIDYDVCYPQLDCVMSSILPLFRNGRIFGYIRMSSAGEFRFETIAGVQEPVNFKQVA